MIDLTESDLATVRNLLSKHLPECHAYVFGSRVRRTAHRFSDLDLALEAETPIAIARLEALREALSESDLPIQIDLVDLHTVTEPFRRRIEEFREEI